YGSVGSYGFQGTGVRERWHAGFQHSGFLTLEFCSKYWIPFLKDGTVVEADEPAPLQRWVRALTLLTLRSIMVVCLSALELSKIHLAATAFLRERLEQFIADLKRCSQKSCRSSPRCGRRPHRNDGWWVRRKRPRCDRCALMQAKQHVFSA